MTENTSLVGEISREIKMQLSNENVGRALLATTFKGLDEERMRQALMEGMIRGFKFDDFLKKNIYALPFGRGYSLVNSIDYSRKVGARSGIVGKKSPEYEMGVDQNGKEIIISCSVTVQKMIGTYVGDFTATVYFAEYYKPGKVWDSMPRTMIAKVAEMHALRMACPEELSQSYIEEEVETDTSISRMKEAQTVDADKLKMGNIIKNGNKKTKEDKDEASATEGVDSEPEAEDSVDIGE